MVEMCGKQIQPMVCHDSRGQHLQVEYGVGGSMWRIDEESMTVCSGVREKID